MSTNTTDNGKIFGNAILDVYDHLDDKDFPRCTISGELTTAVLGDDFDHGGLASNHEAEAEIRKRLKAQDPDLLARLEFDSESGCFFAYSTSREDGLLLAGFITAIASEVEATRPPEPVWKRQERNIIRFSAADVDSILGRQATDDELHAIAKAAGHSSISEDFHEVVELVCGIIGGEDDE